MPNDDVQLEKIAYVLASEHRKNIVLFLDNEYHTPKEIGNAINISAKEDSIHLPKREKRFCITLKHMKRN